MPARGASGWRALPWHGRRRSRAALRRMPPERCRVLHRSLEGASGPGPDAPLARAARLIRARRCAWPPLTAPSPPSRRPRPRLPPASPAALATIVAGAFAVRARVTGTGLAAPACGSLRGRGPGVADLLAAPVPSGVVPGASLGAKSGCRRSAIRLRAAFGAARRGITAVLAARASVAPRVPRSVAPYIAISVAIAAVTMSISVPAAAAAVAVVPRVAMRRPVALGMAAMARAPPCRRRLRRCRTASAKSEPTLPPAAPRRRAAARGPGTGMGTMGAAEAGRMLGTKGTSPCGFLSRLPMFESSIAGLIGELVADRGVLRQFLFVVADSPQRVGRRLHMRIRHDHQRDLVARLDLIEPIALLVHEIGRDIDRNLRDDPAGALLARLFADQAQQRQRHRLDAADRAHAAAARAVDVRGFAQAPAAGAGATARAGRSATIARAGCGRGPS